MAGNTRQIALFNLAIDSKLRGCDLVRLMVRDVAHGSQVLARATVVQQKTKQPVRFEVTDQTREALTAWIAKAKLAAGDYLFPSRQRGSPHLSTRQYARIVKRWIGLLGGDPEAYGTHSLRRTKATLIYRKTKNLRVVQLLLGHTKIDYLPHRTMSRRRNRPSCEQRAAGAAGHSRRYHRLLRNARRLSSGRYRPSLPSGGVVISKALCFDSRLASR